MQFGAGLAVVHDSFRFQGERGCGAQPRSARTDFEAGVGAVEGFALLAGEQPGEFLGGAFDGVGCFEEDGGPARVTECRPCRLGCHGGGDCLLKVFEVVNGGLAHRFACCRVEDGLGRTGRGSDRGQKRIVAGWSGNFGGHDICPSGQVAGLV